MKVRKNYVKPMSRLTCFTVCGILTLSRNFSSFFVSGVIPFDVIVLPKKEILGAIPN